MKRWEESVITILSGTLFAVFGIGIMFGMCYVLMLLAKKVFF